MNRRHGIARDARGGPPPSRLMLVLAERYLRRYFARHFNALRVERGSLAPALSGPTILYANHPSWWDPVVLLLLIRAHYPEWEFQGPIDARALARYPWLERLGLFGIAPGTRAGARRFLERGAALLGKPRAGLALTAQGGFGDVRERPVELERGAARLLTAHPSAVAIPIAIEYTFWNERLPEVLVRFGSEQAAAGGRSCAAVHAALERALENELDRLADAAASRDSDRFVRLIDGRRGVGFWQDLPPKVRALVKGERFDPAHSAIAPEEHGRGGRRAARHMPRE